MQKKAAVSNSKSVSGRPSTSAKTSFTVQPLGDRIVVKPEDAMDERSPSGIIIPDSARKEKPERGTVVAVGEGKRNERGEVLAMKIAIGDVVMFSKYGYDEVKIDDEDYYIVSEPNILAIIK